MPIQVNSVMRFTEVLRVLSNVKLASSRMPTIRSKYGLALPWVKADMVPVDFNHRLFNNLLNFDVLRLQMPTSF